MIQDDADLLAYGELENVIERGSLSANEFEYIRTRTRLWEEDEFRDLLRSLLVTSGTIGIDQRHLQDEKIQDRSLRHETDLGRFGEYWKRLSEYELMRTEDGDPITTGHDGRRIAPARPWEGNTWVLDLVESSPHTALSVIDAYIASHLEVLPDGRWTSLLDAADLIKARYIEPYNQEQIEALLGLTSRQFERLVGRLYLHMGYEVALTKQTRDGGKDVIAFRGDIGAKERLLIEVKRWKKSIPPEKIRALNSVVVDDKATKGVMVTTSYYGRDARDEFQRNDRIELIDGTKLVYLLNRHLGSNWPRKIQHLAFDPLPGKGIGASSTPVTGRGDVACIPRWLHKRLSSPGA